MSSTLFAIFGSLICLSTLTNGQSCDQYTEELTCEVSSSCTWIDASGLCRCASEVKQDILWNVDTSGSIGYNGFQTQKTFIKKMVTQGISNGSNIGFYMFSSNVNASRDIQHWNDDDLLQYVEGLYWTAGFTNTGGVLTASLAEFERSYDPERQQILMLITDGIPCVSGNCPHSVCGYANDFLQEGIRVIIIAVGDFQTAYVECLVQDDDDFIPVASFSDDDFDSILGTLSGITCPVTKDAIFTEVKAEKKQSGWNNRWSRYIEIYNSGVEFNVNDIKLEGLVNMAHGDGPDVTVAQGQYLVFYDAADDSIITDESTVSCHLCGATCTLDECSEAGNSAWADGYCWCENAVYIACSNSGDGDTCVSPLPTGNSNSANDGCGYCSFDDSMDRSNWDVALGDSGSEYIDTVTYDASTWITTWDGYAYELISKSFENDNGANWAQTCSVLGTPGSDPSADCEEECTEDSCGSGGTCDTSTLICDCEDGYYPQCTSATSCVSCLEVPEVQECIVTIFKNGTNRYAFFKWDRVDQIASDTKYRITYYSASRGGETADSSVYDQFYSTTDYYRLVGDWPGWVETQITVCTNTTNGGAACNDYYSSPTNCSVITQSPTTSPTKEPTESPTPDPTSEPTQAPVWPCPEYWWKNEDVCNTDKCNCRDDPDTGVPKTKMCCLEDPIFVEGNDTYDANRTHQTSYGCKLDSDLINWQDRDEGADVAGYSNGYFLQARTHNFLIDISPDDYPYEMDIEWKLEFDFISCSYSDGNDTGTECEEDDPAVAGLSVSPLGGTLTVFGEQDVLNATVSFKVERLSCDEAEDIIANSSNTTTSRRRRRLLSDESCFDNIAVYGNLVIHKATSKGQPECYDGRIYPMRIPVWFNYADAFIAPPSDTEEIPAWLWWLIAGLVVFLGVLAVLVYWYWFKNKKTGAALQAKQIEIDAEVEINENGWQSGLAQNQVGFNPLATGFNPNAPAGAADPNAPLNGGGGQQDFVRTNVEKTVFREQYGPNAGNLR